jgi:hypothetical protein
MKSVTEDELKSQNGVTERGCIVSNGMSLSRQQKASGEVYPTPAKIDRSLREDCKYMMN